ncbi:cytochrome P450 [Leucobacter ruminantium]|uniref:Cytochrome P450 n=1 Tax=Leucobacter ruminantium TaxID=1289170 RepID=A0A939LX30_9MICO|nr:cytochrome P450 [Leucobacter ruminantium]MBO1806414.1 cytochrome P450 [Leucobacter ruminantium]
MSQKSEAVNDFDFHGKALDNIFDDYEVMLSKCPVGHSDKYGGFTYVAKSEDIFAAEQDPDTFSVAPSMMLPSFGTDDALIPIDIDPPAHAAYRKILLPLFTPMNIAKLEPGIASSAKQLAEDVAAAAEQNNGVADVSKLFARPLPTIVFSRLAGYPEEDWPLFDQWVDDIIYRRTKEPDVAWAAGDKLMEYFDGMIKKREAEGGDHDDLIDKVINSRIDGRELTHKEKLSYCFLLFLAGLDTTAWGLRASLWYLAQNPKAQQQLRDNPDQIPMAVEEFLRTLSPVQAMARTCLKDTEIQGQEIKEGERVVLVFGAGNRDPEIFEDPNEIKIDREDNRHLAFGGGIHRCLGSNLARKELVIGLEEFLKRIPSFETGGGEVWHGVGPLTLRIGKE